MASGGARGNAGRVADPNALRRDRAGDAASWVTLEPRSGEVPEFPLESATGRELVLWERLWGRPQASEWERLFLHDEVALYVRYLVEAEQPEAAAAVRTLVKQHQELLGLSTAGLNRLRWRMPEGDVPAVRAPAAKRSSSRGRLKVVGGNE